MIDQSPGIDHRRSRTGTTAKFVQLAVLLLVAAGYLAPRLIPSDGSEFSGCLLAAGGDPSQVDMRAWLRSVLPQIDAFDACRADHSTVLPWWTGIAGIALMLVLAAALFAAIPAWRTRTGRVLPVSRYEKDLLPELEVMAAEVGVRRMPDVFVDPSAASANAVAIGRDGHPVLVLDAGLVLLRNRERGRYEAILRHELAHIGNRDITLTYATVALWRACLLLAGGLLLFWATRILLPTSEGPSELFDPLPILLQEASFIAVLGVLIHLARSDVLRIRESCADLASHSDSQALELHVRVDGREPSMGRRLVRWFVGFWRSHPTWSARSAVIDDPSVLYKVAPLPMFLIGVATGLVVGGLNSLWTLELPNGRWLNLLPMLVPAVLVAGAGGISVWNSVVHALAEHRRSPSGIAAGAWAGLGLAVSHLVLGTYSGRFRLPEDPQYLLLAVAAGAALFWWTAQCARLWFAARSRVPGPAVTLLVLVGVGLLGAAGLALWDSIGVRDLAEGGRYSLEGWRDRIVMVTAPEHGDHRPAVWTVWTVINLSAGPAYGVPFVWLGAVAAWTIPLLGWAMRDNVNPDGATSARGLPRIRRAIAVAAACGFLSWIAVIVVQLDIVRWWEPESQPPSLPRITMYISIFLSLCVASLVAAVFGALVRPYRLLVAVITANIAFLVGLAGTFVLGALSGCVTRLAGASTRCGWFGGAAWGVLSNFVGPMVAAVTGIAFSAAALVALIARLAKRRAVRDLSSQGGAASAPTRNSWPTRLTVLGVCAVVSGFAFGAEVAQSRPGSPSEPTPYDRATVIAEPDVDPPSEETRIQQLKAWYDYGGSDLFDAYADIAEDLLAVLSSQDGTEEVVLSDIRGMCNDLGRLVDSSRQYFEIPNAELQSIWASALGVGATGASDCAQALDSDDPELLWQSFETIFDEMVPTVVLVAETMTILVEEY